LSRIVVVVLFVILWIVVIVGVVLPAADREGGQRRAKTADDGND